MSGLKTIQNNKRLKKYLVILVILGLVLGLAVVPLERGSQINSYSDGLWWAVSTVTGVGYGQAVPVTFVGRLIGVVLMTVGVVLFSLIVVILSASVIHREEKYWSKRMKKEMEDIEDRLKKIEGDISFLVKEKVRKK